MYNYKVKSFCKIIGILFIACFIIIEVAKGHWNWEVENISGIWNDFGSCVSCVALIGFCFEKWMWKWPIFHSWLVPFPCLDGKWKGSIYYSWNGSDHNKDITFVIKQTFFRIIIFIETNESRSRSICASYDFDETRGHKFLIYSYINEPDVLLRETSQIHYGTAKLLYSEQDGSLEGTYWTDRRSVGDIVVTKVK